MGNQNKQRHDEITKQTKENKKYGEITYSIRIKGKNNLEG